MLYQQLTGLLETHRSSDSNWTELKRGHWDTVLESTEEAVFLASGMCSSECTCTACQPWCPGLRVAPTHPPAWQWHLWDGLLSFYKRWQQGQSLRGKKTTKKTKTDCLNLTVLIMELCSYERKSQNAGVSGRLPLDAGGSSPITVFRPMLEMSRSCSLSDSMFVHNVSTIVSTWYSFTLLTSGPKLRHKSATF